MKKLLLIASFFLIVPIANAQFTYGICATGFGDAAKNGTYTEVAAPCGGSGLTTQCFENTTDSSIHIRVYGSRGYSVMQNTNETSYGWNGYSISDTNPIGSWSVSNGGISPAGTTAACAPPPPHTGFPSDSAWTGLFAGGDQLGSSTEMVAGVAGAVSTTGTDLWPLLALLGIGIAFYIGKEMIDFIKKSTKPIATGYYQGGKRMEDQKLGEMEHDIDTKGMWP